jgi:hypothetical protein
MSRNIKNTLSAFRWNDLAEVDMTVSPEKEDEIKKKLNIRYGDFSSFCWGSEETKNGKITLLSPTLPVEAAKKLVRMCPDYAVIRVSAHPLGYEGKKEVYEGPATISANEYRVLQRKVREISKSIEDKDFDKGD